MQPYPAHIEGSSTRLNDFCHLHPSVDGADGQVVAIPDVLISHPLPSGHTDAEKTRILEILTSALGHGTALLFIHILTYLQTDSRQTYVFVVLLGSPTVSCRACSACPWRALSEMGRFGSLASTIASKQQHFGQSQGRIPSYRSFCTHFYSVGEHY